MPALPDARVLVERLKDTGASQPCAVFDSQPMCMPVVVRGDWLRTKPWHSNRQKPSFQREYPPYRRMRTGSDACSKVSIHRTRYIMMTGGRNGFHLHHCHCLPPAITAMWNSTAHQTANTATVATTTATTTTHQRNKESSTVSMASQRLTQAESQQPESQQQCATQTFTVGLGMDPVTFQHQNHIYSVARCV